MIWNKSDSQEIFGMISHLGDRLNLPSDRGG